MAMLAMLWVDHLVQLSSLIFWLSERYQDVESVPEQLKAVHGYYSDLVQYLLTLQRICLPDGTQTLHSDDVQTVRSISERCTQQIHDAANIIGSCIDSYPKVPSFWDSFSGIFIPPEWIKKKDTIGQILQNVKGSMEIISSITGANTHQKVCDMQKQMENMERMISTGLANQNLNRRHRSSSNAQPNGWAFLGNKRKKRHSQTSSALPTQEADPRTELHAKLADLVAGRDEYLWYGIPKEYDSSTQSETTGDLKAIVVMQAGPRSDALAVLVLDMLSSRAIMLKIRDDFPYVTIPSRHDTHTATILVKEIDFSAPKLPQLKAAPDSNAVALLESNATRKIRLCFKDSKDVRAMRNVLEDYEIKHSSLCVGFWCKKIRESDEKNQAAFGALNSNKKPNFRTNSEVINAHIDGSWPRILLLWPFGGVNDTNWVADQSILYVHIVSSSNKYSMKGKTLYLKKISMIATRKGIKCLKNLDDIVKAYGDFELTFERSQDAEQTLNLLLED